MIILRNKEFSSKEQKARRRKFDFQVAKESGRINPKQYFDPEARRRGREELKLRGTKEETYLRNVDHTKSDPGNINAKLRDKWLLKNSDRSIDTRAGSIRSRGSNVSSKAADFIENRTKNYNLRHKKLIAKGVGAGLAVTGGVVAAGIGAKKLYDKKKEKEFSEKKAGKREATAAVVTGAGSLAAGHVAQKYADKANELSAKALTASSRIAKKTGTTEFLPGMVSGSPEAVQRASELSKRYDTRLARGINKAAKGAKISSGVGAALGATSLGLAGVGAYKAIKAKKNKD